MLTRDEIILGYRLILGREPETECVIKEHQKSYQSVADFRLALLSCVEFVAAYLENAPLFNNYTAFPGFRAEELAVFDVFRANCTRPAAGFVTDFLGSRTRTSSLWDGVMHLDGSVLAPPIPGDYHAETIEWIGLLKSVLASKNQFTAMELGAGMGPWLVAGAVAARSRGITDIRLCGIEGDPARFALMRQHFIDNGIDPNEHSLYQAGVGITGGTAKWPRIQDYRNVGGARPVRHSEIGASHLDERDLKYVEGISDQLIDIKVIGFGALLREQSIWDLVHMDVQGTEVELCRSCVDMLSERARYLVVGTHSRKLDGDLVETMFGAGWVLENEKPCRFTFIPGGAALENMTSVDGTQVWRNPRL